MDRKKTDSSARPGPRICGCLVSCTPEEFPGWLRSDEIDIVEWRMDRFLEKSGPDGLSPFWETLSIAPRNPVIATNRPVREMGSFSGTEEERLDILRQAARSGAEWIDLEHDAAADLGDVSALREEGNRVLVSWHSQSDTPDSAILRARLEKMCKTRADAIKIVTLARREEDNLRVLELIPFARKELQIDLVAFCMGAAGKWSRLVSLLMGSPWSYAQLPGQCAAAPGQISAPEMRDLLRIMSRT